MDRPENPVLIMVIDERKMASLAEATSREDVAGRSLWANARRRFFQNKAAIFGLCLLIFVVAFALFGNWLAAWNNSDIDYNVMGDRVASAPSFADGHYFGADDLGRDLFARTVQGTQISLLVGVIGTMIAVTVGTLYGAIAGYFGGRIDGFMMRLVDILL